PAARRSSLDGAYGRRHAHGARQRRGIVRAPAARLLRPRTARRPRADRSRRRDRQHARHRCGLRSRRAAPPRRAGAAAASCVLNGRAADERGRPMTDAVLVHGAWHGAWCWAQVVDALAALGLSSKAVELPLTGLADDAATARSAIEAAGPGVVVVGHS